MCAFYFGKPTFRAVGELSVGSLNVPLPFGVVNTALRVVNCESSQRRRRPQ
jgi:hypothetical protein